MQYPLHQNFYLNILSLFFWQKCKIDPLTFTFFHFNLLTFSFVNSVFQLSIFVNSRLHYKFVIIAISLHYRFHDVHHFSLAFFTTIVNYIKLYNYHNTSFICSLFLSLKFYFFLAKMQTNPLTFTFFHFNPLTFSFANSVL